MCFRPINLRDDEGCVLDVKDGVSTLDIRRALPVPLNVIGSGKARSTSLVSCHLCVPLHEITLIMSFDYYVGMAVCGREDNRVE